MSTIEKKIDEVQKDIKEMNEDVEMTWRKVSEIASVLLEVSSELRKSNENFFKITEKINRHELKFKEIEERQRNFRIWNIFLSIFCLILFILVISLY